MSKWQTAKLLMLGVWHLATGIALILGILVALGPLMEALIKLYSDEAMPLWISLIPLLVTFIGVGWGAFFMWKALVGQAPAILFYLIGKAGYRILGLQHITIRRRRGIAALVMLVALIAIIIELVPTGFNLFSKEPIIAVAHPFIVATGVVAIIVSIAIGAYKPVKEMGNE